MAGDLEPLLAHHGPYLRSLEVAGLKLTSSAFVYLSHCPLLESLHILPSEPFTLLPEAVQSLCRLTGLRDLELGVCLVTHNQVNQLLQPLVKLKQLSLINVPTVFPLRQPLLAYARRFPRRRITVWLSYDDRPNASPPRRLDARDTRTSRAPPGLSNIEVIGNLRIMYTH